jgi:hypothetical protein
VANAVADGHITVVPEVLDTGGGGGSFDGLAATLMRYLGTGASGNGKHAAAPAHEPPEPGPSTEIEAAELTEKESRPSSE